MKNKFFMLLILISAVTCAQSFRSLNNKGVEEYGNKKYQDAELNFRKGIDKDSANFRGYFNLGDSYYKQEKYNEALGAYQSAAKRASSKDQMSAVMHNLGNTLLKAGKIEESVEAYKNSLKLKPSDKDTKYNLSYALNLLKQQQQKNQNKDQKNNKDQDKKDQQKNQDKKDDKKDQDKKDQQKQNQDQKDQQKQDQQKNNPAQQKEQEMKKQQAEKMLEALKNNEKDLQKKLRQKVGVRVKTGKDW